MLTADLANVFAHFEGEIGQAGEVDTVQIHLTPENFSIDGGHATLGFLLSAANGSGLAPDTVVIDSLDPGNAPTIEQQVGLPGGSSLVLGKLKYGDFDLQLAGTDDTTGAWELQIFLAGDVSGDFVVDETDVGLLNDVLNGTITDPDFFDEADSDRDGQITGYDLARAAENKGVSTSVRVLTVTTLLDPASDTGVLGDDLVNQTPVNIVGLTLEAAQVSLDEDGDGFDDGTTIAAAVTGATNYSLSADLLPGANTLRVEARDSFGQWARAETVVTLDVVAPTVVSTSPTEGEEVNPVSGQDIPVELVFSEPMIGSTVLAALSVSGDISGPIIPLGVEFDQPTNTLSFELSESLTDGAVTVVVAGSATDLAGNALDGGPFSLNFTVNRVTTITQMSPANGEEMVSVTREAIVRFSGPIDPATVTSDAVHAIALGAQVPGRLVVSSTERFVTFYPDDPWNPSTEVRFQVNGDLIMGRNGQAVDADGDGAPGGTATADFTTLPLTRIPGTNVFGYIYDSYNKNPDGSDIPVVGATIRVDAFPEANAVTDANGYFILENMPAPEFFVHIDGSTATNAPPGFMYASLGKPLMSVPGQTVQTGMGGMPFDMYLPPMAMGDVVPLSPTETTDVGFGDAGKAELVDMFPEIDPAVWDLMKVEFAPGAAVDDFQNPATQAVIIPVPPDRIPGRLPPNLQPKLVISIQAFGATNFDIPAPMTFPNLEGLAPGEKSLMFSFNHDTGRFDVIGAGTVSEDGLSIVSDPGVGVPAPGWHFTQPGSAAGGNSGGDGGPDTGQENPGQENGDDFPNDISKKETADVDDLDPDLTDAFQDIIDAYEDSGTNFDPLISSGNDGAHGTNSAHYTDEAIDLSSWSSDYSDYMTQDQIETIVDSMTGSERFDTPTTSDPNRQQSNWDRDGDGVRDLIVIIEHPGETGEQHIHVQIPPELRSPPPSPLDSQSNVTLEADQVTTTIHVSGGPYFVAIELQNGFVQRFSTRSDGSYSAVVPSNTEGGFHLWDPGSGFVKHGRFYSGPSGTSFDFFNQQEATWQGYRELLGPCDVSDDEFGTCYTDQFFGSALWDVSRTGDADGDLLPDDVEFIVGTSASETDTDGDGIDDFAEITQGLDPLDDRGFPTGIISSLPLAGPANEVVVEESTAYVATGSHGLALVDVGQFNNPILLGQIDLGGNATDVAVDPALARAAVATNLGGLAIVDVSDPMMPEVAHVTTNVLGSRVEVLDGVAYVSVGGSLTSVDLLTGGILETISLGGTITDIAREGSFLYTMNTGRQLRVVDITGGNMVARGSVFLPNGGGKLFVGNGIAYAAAANTSAGGFATANVSNPDSPTVISGTDAPTTSAPGTSIVSNGSGIGLLVGRSLRVTGDPPSLQLVDVSDPANTYDLLLQIGLPATPSAIAVASGIAFVADGSAGLQVINYLPFDSQGQPPTVVISSSAVDVDPATPGVQVVEGTSIPIQANVTDDVQVRNVELIVNGEVVRNDVSFPFDFSAIALSNDPEAPVTTVQVRATDTGGNVALSNTLTIDLAPDTFPPTIVSVEPADGAQRPQGHRTVRIRFSEPIDAASVSTETFSIVEAGPDGVLGNTDDVAVEIVNLQLRSDDTLVQLTTDPLEVGFYRIGILQDTVADRAGNALGTGLFTSDFEVVEAIPITITFGSFSHSHPLSYTESGLTVTSRQSHVHLESGRLRNHSSCCSTPYQFTFAGAPFSVASLDVISTNGSGSFTSSSGAVMPITGTGTMTFPAEGWTNLTSFRWDKPSGSTVIDNLTILAAPVSAAPLVGLSAQPGEDALTVTAQDAHALAHDAADLWAVSLDLAELIFLEIAVEDLPADQVATAQRLAPATDQEAIGLITLDVDANGAGWFVDSSPWDDSEFGVSLADTAFEATLDSPAAGRFDLFTVLLHEVGHLLGFTDSNPGFASYVVTADDGTQRFAGSDFTATLTADGDHLDGAAHPWDLMNATLSPSVRKLPSALDVQILTAAYGASSSDTGFVAAAFTTSALALTADAMDAGLTGLDALPVALISTPLDRRRLALRQTNTTIGARLSDRNKEVLDRLMSLGALEFGEFTPTAVRVESNHPEQTDWLENFNPEAFDVEELDSFFDSSDSLDELFDPAAWLSLLPME